VRPSDMLAQIILRGWILNVFEMIDKFSFHYIVYISKFTFEHCSVFPQKTLCNIFHLVTCLHSLGIIEFNGTELESLRIYIWKRYYKGRKDYFSRHDLCILQTTKRNKLDHNSH